MFGRKTQERVAGKATLGAARGAGKAALGAGKVLKGGARSRSARNAARGAGKATLKGGSRVLTPGRSVVPSYLKYGFFALIGFAVGALVARSGNREDASTFTGTTGQHTPDSDSGSPAGQRGATWGSETPTGSASGSAVGMVSDPAAPASHQRLEDPNRTGAEREYSDPSTGPLIGRSHRDRTEDIPVQEEEVENRIRTRVGEDPRTLDLPHLNVEVNDGVADIRGEVHTDEEKKAVEEIASNVEGVTEVRNLLTVNPDAPSRHKADDEPSHQ
jgi:hypothetical protein